MNRLDLPLNKQDPKAYRYRKARAQDFGQLIDSSTQVFVEGKLRIHFEVLRDTPTTLVNATRGINYIKGYRSEGLLSQSRVFGGQPRLTIRRDFCTMASIAREHPAEQEVLFDWAQAANRVYRSVNPELHAKAEETLQQVKDSWRIRDTVFTSGIANKDNALFYHLDAGNFPDLWSAMFAFSMDCEGGHLAVPELGIGFSFAKPALIMFDGQSLIHGVTPLVKKSKQAYRYSVVYYALRQMCKCGTLDEELDRIRKVKTTREVKRGKPA